MGEKNFSVCNVCNYATYATVAYETNDSVTVDRSTECNGNNLATTLNTTAVKEDVHLRVLRTILSTETPPKVTFRLVTLNMQFCNCCIRCRFCNYAMLQILQLCNCCIRCRFCNCAMLQILQLCNCCIRCRFCNCAIVAYVADSAMYANTCNVNNCCMCRIPAKNGF